MNLITSTQLKIKRIFVVALKEFRKFYVFIFILNMFEIYKDNRDMAMDLISIFAD